MSGLPLVDGFRLGEWLVEPSLNRVFRGDTSFQLELKVMEVLVCLADGAGRVVSATQIIDTVWQTEFISVNSLTHAIAEIRRVLGDDARNPRYIETITKCGYRLMIPVERLVAQGFKQALPRPSCAIVMAGRHTALTPGDNLVGRAPDVAVRIDDPQVSRHHAKIVVSPDSVAAL